MGFSASSMGQIEVIEWVRHERRFSRVDWIDLITTCRRKAASEDDGAGYCRTPEEALALCNRLVVSTEPLSRHYSRFCDETIVLANRLEKSRWLGIEAGRRRAANRVSDGPGNRPSRRSSA